MSAIQILGESAFIDIGHGLTTVCDASLLDSPIPYRTTSGLLIDVVISKCSWHRAVSTSKGVSHVYARACCKRKIDGKWRSLALKMHRVICGAKPGELVDHEDRDRLNNRRSNLRIATSTQNAANAVRKRSVSRYRGLGWIVRGQTWMATIRAGGRNLCIGTHKSDEQAARLYDTAARLLYGEFAVLNFPDLDPVELRPHIVQRLYDLIAMRDRRFTNRRTLPGATP